METKRLSSLDQFRGYTVLGMVFVNFVGSSLNIPKTFSHHHVYCSYADTIMPSFLFCVGMAMRITLMRRVATEGKRAAFAKAIKRNLGLIFIGCIVYHFTGGFKSWKDIQDAELGPWFLATIKRGPFEALTHIGMASLFVLPVIVGPWWVRLLYAALAAWFHSWCSENGYYTWNLKGTVGIDGGPLGFLSWSVPLLVGTLVVDLLEQYRRPGIGIFTMGIVLMAIALALADPATRTIPLIHPANTDNLRKAMNYWTMSQRAGSISYTIFGAGFATVVFCLFRILCDRLPLRWSYLDLLGRHALIVYVAHGLVMECVKPFVPKDAPAWFVLMGFGVYLVATTLIVRYFDRNGLAVRL